MKRFKLLNTSFGWLAFVIAAVTYLLTMERTASFWDCGAFILAANTLEITHPPGAPFYMLTGRLFALFAPDASQVALMVNALSAILSALTILFLFWTITHLARKIIVKNEDDYTVGNIISILGAGMVGALAYTFSDTFWFSAVEAEVYAYASFFTAVVVWLMLKWEDNADEKNSDRWLILIAYLIGLSIGVHLLNLLTIPVLVLIYYFKKYETSTKGFIIALVVSVLILAFVLFGFIQGYVGVASWFELLFINTLGFSFNTGLLVHALLTIGILIWAIYETYIAKNQVRMVISFVLGISMLGIPFLGARIGLGIFIILAMAGFLFWKRTQISARWLNTVIVMVSVMFIGFSSYTITVIRSSANPPLDQSSPDNIFSLMSYLNREQYGDTPLLRGAVFNAPIKLEEIRVPGGITCAPVERSSRETLSRAPKTSPDDRDRYIVTGSRVTHKMNEQFYMLFPRMHNAPGLSERQIEAYRSWSNMTGRRVRYDFCRETRTEVIPTFGENMRFFFTYQLGFMYWRYFMWNFSGRQNDIQGHGEIEHGNWITGFNFIDKHRVGCQNTLPTDMRENKGRNRYYMLPLLLGILGIIFHLFHSGKEGKQHFWIVFFFFVMTGIAIVVYLNQTPYQVRERDYAYAGSFYAFSIWIGLGVLTLIRAIDRYIPRAIAAGAITAISLGVPALMASENWDDHDRSNRFMARDFGHNYLVSTAPNAILFSMGDNDTFPLWYNQKVEGVRTDVRVCNLSYLQTDWYVQQMKRGQHQSAPLPISWSLKDYIGDTNQAVRVEDLINRPLSVRAVFDFLLDDDPSTQRNGENFIPTRQLYIPIDADQVIASGTLPESRRDEIVPRIYFNLNRSHLTRQEMMILEMLNENNWERPMYFAATVPSEQYLGLDRAGHLELTGITFQIVPVISETGVNVDKMFDNMMNKFRFGNASDPRIYIDETSMRMAIMHRNMFSRLVSALIETGDSVRALQALDYAFEVLPGKTIPYDITAVFLAMSYYELNEFEKGDRIMSAFANNAVEHLIWYFNLTPQQRRNAMNLGRRFSELHHAMQIFHNFNRTELFEKYHPFFTEFSQRLN